MLTFLLAWALARAAAAGTCGPLPAGAVAWWRAENDKLDSVSLNDVTSDFICIPIVLFPPFTAGKVGRAFERDVCEYFIVPVSPDLDVVARARV